MGTTSYTDRLTEPKNLSDNATALPKHTRSFGLDLLRALAILLVLIDHTRVLVPLPGYRSMVSGFGVWGVELFFVLSGFLVGGIALRIFDRLDVTWSVIWSFWRRRWYRTLPAYYLALMLNFALVWWNTQTLPNFSGHLLFVQNLAWPHSEFFGEAWTLAIEEWFYLLLPLILMAGCQLTKTRRYGILFAIIVVLVGSLVGRLVWAFLHPDPALLTWGAYFRRIVFVRGDALMTGVLGAYLVRYHHTRWSARPLLMAAVGAVGFVCAVAILRIIIIPGHNGLATKTLFFSLVSFSLLGFFPAVSALRRPPAWIAEPITALSRWSYAIYLLHGTFLLHGFVLPNRGWVVLIGYLVLTLGVAAAVYACWEKPMMDLRDRNSVAFPSGFRGRWPP